MADSTIIIDIIARSSEVEKGVSDAIKSLDKLKKSEMEAGASTENLQKQFKKAGDAADDAGDDLQDLNKRTGEVGKQAKSAASSEKALEEALSAQGESAEAAASKSEKAAEKIEKTGKKSGEAKKNVLGLRDAANKLKSSFSILAIGGAFVTVTKQLLQVQQATADAAREFDTLYGKADVAARKLGESMDAVQKLIGGDEDTKKLIAQAGGREFADLSYNQRMDIQQEALDIQKATGVSGSSYIYQVGEIIDKYELEREDAVSVMKQILEVAKLMPGDIGENIESVTGTLTGYDNVAKAMGWDYDRMLQNILSLNSAENANRKDPQSSFSILERQYQNQQSNIISAEKDLPQFKETLKDLYDERDKLTKELYQAEAEDQQEIISSIGDIDDEIAEVTDSINALEQILSMTPGELTESLLNGTTLGDLVGKDREEAKEVLSLLKLAPSTETVPTADNTVAAKDKTILENIGSAWGTFWTNAGGVMAGDNTTKSLVEQKTAARTELTGYISTLRKEGFEDLAKKYEEVTKPGTAVTNPELSLDELTSAIKEATGELSRLGLMDGTTTTAGKEEMGEEPSAAKPSAAKREEPDVPDYGKASESLGAFAGTAETATEKVKELDDITGGASETIDEFAENTEDAEGAQSELNDTEETTNETSGMFRDTLAEVNTNLIGLSTESTNAATTLSSVFDVQINTTIGWLNAMAEALRTVIALQSQVE